MLKRLPILGLLLLFAPSVSGQPNQATDSKQRSGTQGQPAVIPPDAQGKHATSETDQPKASGNPPKWYAALERPDWWLVLAAFSTFGVICWQSVETRKAAQGAKANAVAALAQIEFMKSKERAQLRIEFGRPKFAYDAKLKGYPVEFRITLDGTTRAYVLDESIFAYLSQSRRTSPRIWKGIGIPRNLTPEDSPYEGQTLIHKPEGFPAEFETDMNKFRSVLRGEDGYTVYVDGSILYRDIFGDQWILEIDRYWSALSGTWAPYSSGRGDNHRRVEPRKEKPHNPN